MEIGPRAKRIRTNDKVDITGPNSAFIEDRVTIACVDRPRSSAAPGSQTGL